MDAAISVYPITDAPRHLLSFRNGSDGQYEVTASTEREFDLTVDEPETIIESIPSLPIATQSKGNTLRIGSHKKREEIFDIKKGIPSSETLYVNLLGDDFIAGYEYETHIHKIPSIRRERRPSKATLSPCGQMTAKDGHRIC